MFGLGRQERRQISEFLHEGRCMYRGHVFHPTKGYSTATFYTYAEAQSWTRGF